MDPRADRKVSLALVACSSAFLFAAGCAGVAAGPSRYAYFTPPAAGDQWSPKIAGWQRRERADDPGPADAPAPVSEPAPDEAEPAAISPPEPVSPADLGQGLRAKYLAFRAEQKRATARSVAVWTQSQALEHYMDDGPIDHWATLEETLRNNGDDCDGLELLTFNALRGLGFGASEVFRAIVYRSSDGQHHMVTLWFEDPQDPWVIDPTGAMTLGMPRMSELPGWVPIKLFSDTLEYTVSPEALEPLSVTVVADSR
jgi:hypothetical protein